MNQSHHHQPHHPHSHNHHHAPPPPTHHNNHNQQQQQAHHHHPSPHPSQQQHQPNIQMSPAMQLSQQQPQLQQQPPPQQHQHAHALAQHHHSHHHNSQSHPTPHHNHHHHTQQHHPQQQHHAQQHQHHQHQHHQQPHQAHQQHQLHQSSAQTQPQQQQPLQSAQAQPQLGHQPAHQQQSPQQPQMPQMPPPHAHHHMTHHPQPQMIMNHPQYQNYPYYHAAHMGHPTFGLNHPGHIGHPPAHFNHHPATPSHRPDRINSNSQQQPQQQPASISNHHHQSNVTPIVQVPPVISTAVSGTTNVHQSNSGPVIDTNRAPINQAYLLQTPYMQTATNLPMMHPAYQMTYINAYQHQGHMHQTSPNIMPQRVQTDVGARQPFEPANHAAAIPTETPHNIPPAPVGVPAKPVPVAPAATLVTPTPTVRPIKPRQRMALSIVDPVTKHVFTEDELRGTPASSSEASTTTKTSPTISDASTPATAPTLPLVTNSNSSTTPTQISNQVSVPQAESSSSPPPSAPHQRHIASTVDSSTHQAVVCEQEESTQVQEQTATAIIQIRPTASETTSIQSPLSSVTQSLASLLPLSAPQQATAVNGDSPVESSSTSKIEASTHATPDLDPSTKAENSSARPTVELTPSTDTQTPAGVDNMDSLQPLEVDSNHGIVESKTELEAAADSISDELRNGNESETVSDETNPKDTPKKKVNSNLPYQAGQFSPLNPSGSKKYTIEFLKAVYKEIEAGLPARDNSPHFENSNFDFTPNFIKLPMHGHNHSSGPLMRRSSQQPTNKPRRIILTHSLQPEVELNTAETPWKPELDKDKSKAIESGEMDTLRLLKVFRGHLNKLTPQKYDSLIEKIQELDLSSPERLSSVIDLVFDKAVDEPGFCELYARMCKVIAMRQEKFCYHLVKKCQEEFETPDLYKGINVDERKLAIEAETDSSKKKLLSEELYEDMRVRRKKYLGTIKLIGEMYKLGLLLPKIIALCMNHLITSASNENLECLCSLITTVGQKLSGEPDAKIREYLKSAMTILHEFASNSDKTGELFVLESRIKFKLLDTIELSRRNWRPRMVENNPKKIEEIREEAAKEEMSRSHHNHSNQPKNPVRGGLDDRDRRRVLDKFHKGLNKW